MLYSKEFVAMLGCQLKYAVAFALMQLKVAACLCMFAARQRDLGYLIGAYVSQTHNSLNLPSLFSGRGVVGISCSESRDSSRHG